MHKPIKIYCLVNPVNEYPFYVGATNGNLNVRLSAHLSEVAGDLFYYWFSPPGLKHYVLREFIDRGIKPTIVLLHTCTIHDVDYYERFFYNLLISQGFLLTNDTTRFYYKNQKQLKINNNHFNTSITKYLSY